MTPRLPAALRALMLGSAALLLPAAVGCSSMAPGQMSAVQTVSDRQRAGNVYLLRGFIGIFSTGIDHLGEEINAAGVHAEVYQDSQWQELADTIADKYSKAGPDREPIVLIGHSFGADDVLRISTVLKQRKIPVDLVVTLDPVTPPKVPDNIQLTYNVYRPNGLMDALPCFRGIPLEPEEEKAAAKVRNINIRTDPRNIMEPGTDHFNIEKKAKVHQVVIEQVLAKCPPRGEWVAHLQYHPLISPAPVYAPPTAKAKEAGTKEAGAMGPTVTAGPSANDSGAAAGAIAHSGG